MSRNTAVSPIIADIKEANNYNFQQVPVLGGRKNRKSASGESTPATWAGKLVRRCNIETVVYMIEPWERVLVQAVLVLFVASALHFTFGTTINWISFFE